MFSWLDGIRKWILERKCFFKEQVSRNCTFCTDCTCNWLDGIRRKIHLYPILFSEYRLNVCDYSYNPAHYGMVFSWHKGWAGTAAAPAFNTTICTYKGERPHHVLCLWGLLMFVCMCPFVVLMWPWIYCIICCVYCFVSIFFWSRGVYMMKQHLRMAF